MHILWIMFNWPNGIVLGNLLASMIWGIPALTRIHSKLNKHHQVQLAMIRRKI